VEIEVQVAVEIVLYIFTNLIIQGMGREKTRVVGIELLTNIHVHITKTKQLYKASFLQ